MFVALHPTRLEVYGPFRNSHSVGRWLLHWEPDAEKREEWIMRRIRPLSRKKKEEG